MANITLSTRTPRPDKRDAGQCGRRQTSRHVVPLVPSAALRSRGQSERIPSPERRFAFAGTKIQDPRSTL